VEPSQNRAQTEADGDATGSPSTNTELLVRIESETTPGDITVRGAMRMNGARVIC
jgi:hypothetical protein